MRWPSSCASVAIKWSGGMARAPSVTKRVKYRQGEVVAGELHTLTLSVRMMAKPILQSLTGRPFEEMEAQARSARDRESRRLFAIRRAAVAGGYTRRSSTRRRKVAATLDPLLIA